MRKQLKLGILARKMLCSCGCGKTTPIAKRTRKELGHIKGQHFTFCKGHRLVKTAPLRNNCRKCKIGLVIGENIRETSLQSRDYLCFSCTRNYRQAYYQGRLKEKREKQKTYARNLRLKVLAHYGDKCACCGETRKEFLAIDHINNDGASDRKFRSAKNWFLDIINRGYPDNLRLLCHNCNSSRGYYGYCPHERERGE